jgi:hypothetical protein
MTTFKVRLSRSISHETEIVVEAISEKKAREEALRQAGFLIWDVRNSAEYKVLWAKAEPGQEDEDETKSDLKVRKDAPNP